MYLDSGSGSMLVSAIVAGAAGAGVVAKVGVRKVTGVFKRDKTAATPEITPTTDVERQ